MNTKYVVNALFLCALLLNRLVSNAQSNHKLSDYSKLPLSGFFFPEGNLNKSTYTHFDDKGNIRTGSVWYRYYITKKKESLNTLNTEELNAKMYGADIVDEQIFNSRITSSTLKQLLVTEKTIQIIGERTLNSVIPNQYKKYDKSVIILAKPISKETSSEWQRIEDDGTIVTSVASFIDYDDKGTIIPTIKVQETKVLRSANINIKMEYYYLYGLGLMASTIFNKTSKTLVPFDKILNLEYDKRLNEEKVSVEETEVKVPTPEQIFTVVEIQPEFPGGMAGLVGYLQKNLIYPAKAQKAGVSGRVFVSFVINDDGSIQDVQILKGLGHGTDEEAVRVIKAMPKWTPGKQKGKPVRVKYNLPISFSSE